MPAIFPCKTCNNPVAKDGKAVECDNCGLWVHIKCNKLKLTNTSKKKVVPGIVFLAEAKIFPFPNLNEDDFHKTIHGKKVKFLTIAKKKETKMSKYLLKK